MYLHDHTHARFFRFQPAIDRNHRPFDNIGSGSLHRGVNRRTLRTRSTRAVAGFNIRQIETTAFQRFNVALLFRLSASAFHILQHAGITFKIEVHVFLRFFTRNIQLARQNKGAHPVDQTEVDGFRAAALLAGHRIKR
ncbi:hypothetical protein SDC9_117092 [bioreactor metagenome]|uniref:Uncharacterized protein n=1 Tax=bioreactor metagenome TaxID=1076179 RepID=A0A645BXM6_9ZZZZ